jgi:hypothetical protein
MPAFAPRYAAFTSKNECQNYFCYTLSLISKTDKLDSLAGPKGVSFSKPTKQILLAQLRGFGSFHIFATTPLPALDQSKPSEEDF